VTPIKCPDPVSERFQYDPQDEIKTQTGSNAIQPCKLYFSKLGTGGWAGRQWGEREGKEKEKGETVVRQPEQARKGVQGRSATTTKDPAMSSWLSLYAGVEVPVKTGSGRKHQEKENKGPQRSMCSPFIWAFTHAQSVFVYMQFVPYVLPA